MNVMSDSGNEKFLSLSLLLGLAAAIATLIFFGWLADEALEGATRHFDEATRAAVHQLASPTTYNDHAWLLIRRLYARAEQSERPSSWSALRCGSGVARQNSSRSR